MQVFCDSIIYEKEREKMIGREREIKGLNKLYESNSSELIAIYGRLGVGKTYLVEEVFSKRITFKHTGVSSMGG